MELQSFLSNYTGKSWLHRYFFLKKPSLKK
nr:MAG TPA: hypothetical protein [Caudoviricetes sp.]DAX54315.1 MAG TPA: hypothetical protein [Caudoviricetes sp.]